MKSPKMIVVKYISVRFKEAFHMNTLRLEHRIEEISFSVSLLEFIKYRKIIVIAIESIMNKKLDA